MYLAAFTRFHDSLLSLYLRILYAKRIQKGINITMKPYVINPGHTYSSYAAGTIESLQSPLKKKQPVAPRSLSGFTKLVRISATMKCLKVTTVNGDINTSIKTLSISNLAVR